MNYTKQKQAFSKLEYEKLLKELGIEQMYSQEPLKCETGGYYE